MADRIEFTLDLTRFNRKVSALASHAEQDALQVVMAVAADVLADTVQGWPVDTGLSRGAWWGPRRVGPAAAQIGNPVRYARVIEYGGYRGVGPKTVRVGGQRLPAGLSINPGIYPRQRPAAPLRRALATNYGHMTRLLRERLRRRWRT
jgi:hypothetical protein